MDITNKKNVVANVQIKNLLSSGSDSKESPCSAGDMGWSLGQKEILGEEMAIHFSILAWGIPWTEEPGVL